MLQRSSALLLPCAVPARGGVGLSGEGGRVVALRQRRRCVLGSLRMEGSELGEVQSPSAVDSNAELLQDTAAERRRVEAARLQKMAEEAAAAARDAEKRAQTVKTGPMQQLAALSQKVKKDSQRARLREEAEARAAEAARLAALADEAETTRGTATLANTLAEKARIEIRLADDAERKIRELDGAVTAAGGPCAGAGAVAREPVTLQSVTEALKGVRLVPLTGARADIARVTDQLDDLKTQGLLQMWGSAESELGAGGFRGGSSVEQVRAATQIAAEISLDSALGVSAYTALQFKNYFSGSLMLAGGIGLILAGAAETSGAMAVGSAGPAIEVFGYAALLFNILIGIFNEDTSALLSRQLYAWDVGDYRQRAITCEAAHLLAAYLCGLPLAAYAREHVGYPIKKLPTGRAQVYSTRRGDPEVAGRKRPLGLPPWASLEQEGVDEDGLFGLDSMAVRGGYSAKEIDHLSLVLLAGPVAEQAVYGTSTNGALQFQQLDTCMLMSADVMSPSQMQAQARWGIIKASLVLKKHRRKLDAVISAMEREASLNEIVALIESTPV